MKAVQAQRGFLGGWRPRPRSPRGSQSHCRSRVHVQAPSAVASTAPSSGDNSQPGVGYLSCTSAVRDDWALVKVRPVPICACCRAAARPHVSEGGRALHRLRSRSRTTTNPTTSTSPASARRVYGSASRIRGYRGCGRRSPCRYTAMGCVCAQGDGEVCTTERGDINRYTVRPPVTPRDAVWSTRSTLSVVHARRTPGRWPSTPVYLRACFSHFRASMCLSCCPTHLSEPSRMLRSLSPRKGRYTSSGPEPYYDPAAAAYPIGGSAPTGRVSLTTGGRGAAAREQLSDAGGRGRREPA